MSATVFWTNLTPIGEVPGPIISQICELSILGCCGEIIQAHLPVTVEIISTNRHGEVGRFSSKFPTEYIGRGTGTSRTITIQFVHVPVLHVRGGIISPLLPPWPSYGYLVEELRCVAARGRPLAYHPTNRYSNVSLGVVRYSPR